jgi:Tol biopolymer transport system component
MAFASGSRLGPYEILIPIGAGGMGEVYKARDTRLDRVVAIKVSKDQFSERFEREARAVASLNHPHICHLYDVGPNYLVMEFVEGAPIRPSDSEQQIIELAVQIADGLAAAHAAGVVHRDLKPGNILVTRTGQAKILDFGLAKMTASATHDPDAKPTEMVTDSGVAVGTAAYMSPEQARGQPVDARSDLWSLGVVLYEMATRVRPFDGSAAPVVFEAVLGRLPLPVRERNPKISPELARIISRLLEKDKALRYQSAADLGADLRRVERDSSAVGHPVAPARDGHVGRNYAVGAGVAALVLVGGASLFYATRPSASVTSPSEYVQLTNFTDSVASPSLSPDGRMVTFIRGGEFCCAGGSGQIYVKLLPAGESVRLTNDSTPKLGPVFTPDGTRVAYTNVRWDTWTVPVLGGQPSLLLPNAFGLTWIADHRVLFSQIKSGLHLGVVTSTEGRADLREVYFPTHERAMAHFSHLSPDGKSVLVVEMDQTVAWQPCRLVPFDGSSAGRRVGPQGQCLASNWSPDGRWMYFSVAVGGASHLWRQRFPDGAPEQITFGPTQESGVAVAPDGRSLVTAVGSRQSVIWLHDATGDRAISSEGYAEAVRLSPDGSTVFYLLRRDSTSSSAELRSLDLASGTTNTVLPGQSLLDYDISHEGRQVAFTTKADGGGWQIWLASLDRRTPPRRIAQAGDQVSFAGDDTLVFRSLDEKTNFLSRIKTDGTGRERIISTPILNKTRVSPDGKWALSMVAGPPGEASLQTTRFVAIPTAGGPPVPICCLGVWSADGKMFYTSARRNGRLKTIAIPLPAGTSLPDLSEPHINSAVEIPDSSDSVGATAASSTIAVTSLNPSFAPGRDRSTFVFVKQSIQRNLFQIPLH